MRLPTIKKLSCRGKRVLLRTGFDVPIKRGKVKEDFRIKKGLATIKFLQKKGAKIIILNHVGRKKESQRSVANYLRRYFPKVKFIPYLFGPAVKKSVSQMKNGDIIMLENLRINSAEEKNDKNFSKKLASLGDIYVNDAFSNSHRPHASIVGIPKYLPSYAGLLFEKEFKNLKSVFRPRHPFLLILGGVKFENKQAFEKFIKISDKVFIGGALANNFFKAKGMDIGQSVFDKNVSVKKYLNNKKIILPVDVKRKNGKILDIGPKSVKELASLIRNSKFIFWNGPLGKFEEKNLSSGTFSAAKSIAKSHAISIAGGGDTVTAITKLGLISKFSFVSTAGGAMLEFLAKGTLPGIEALTK
jgi:phosphoglycerate kinase